MLNIDSSPTPPSVQGGWIEFWESDTEDDCDLTLSEQYAVLIVLNGELRLSLKGWGLKVISKESLVVVDREQIISTKCGAGTAILKYTPPQKIFRFFGSCSSVFKMPCSAVVPVLPALQAWIDDIMATCLKPKEELTHALRREYCARLGNILRSYPPLMVGELLIPFHACSITGKEKCSEQFCK